MKIAAIVPAYNEAERIAGVLSVVLRCPSVDEVVAVNDGSTDRTAEVVRAFPEVCLVSLPVNRGKGAALAAGVSCTDADILVFLDADLIGLNVAHVEDLVSPVRTERAEMAVGRFRGGRMLTDMSQRLVPNVSGQRAIRREVFEQIPNIGETRYGVEMAMTRFCRYYRVPTVAVTLAGVTHPMKEEKLGLVRGWAARARMYGEIVAILANPRAPRPRTRLGERSIPRLLRRLTGASLRDEGALWMKKHREDAIHGRSPDP